MSFIEVFLITVGFMAGVFGLVTGLMYCALLRPLSAALCFIGAALGITTFLYGLSNGGLW